VRHIVAFKFKPDASADHIQQITDAFRALPGKIPGIVSMEDGTNNSPEGKNHGCTHVYLLTFADAAARDAYLPHPEHAQFGQLLRQLRIVDDAFVIDFTANP
jgi:stress responsive alpha/beta barrel protein